MIECGQKSKPKKVPRASNNPQKSLDQKLTPQKSHGKFPSLKNFQEGSIYKSQAKDIKNSLQQKMDEKSVECIEALLDRPRTLCRLLYDRFYETDAM